MATIRDVAEVLIKIDDKEAKTKMPELEKRAEALRTKWEGCFKNGDTKGMKDTGKELRKVYREMDSLQKRTMDVDNAMQHLSTATPKELRKIMAQINRELESGAIQRGTKEWDEYNGKLKQVKTELKKIADEQKAVTDSGMSFKDMLDIGGNLSMIFGSVLDLKDNIADFVRDNVNSYIAYDAELANVQKFTGMTRESVEELNEEFKKIDTRTSVVELNKLAEEAGRLGKTSKEDILGFVKAADIINVALDDLGEGATLEISKLTSIFGDEKALGTEKSMLAVGSVINELSQNCTAAAPYLANFTKRLAGVGAQADMTIPQIMGFAAVLDSQGQAVEMSATAVSQLITKMFQDPAKIAKAVGMDVKKFTDMVKTDTNGALLTLLERLNALGNMDVLAPIFKEMGTDGARASAVLASLAGNVDMVRQQQELATEAYKEATSVVKEFNVQNETEEAKLEKRRKQYEEVKVLLGQELLPVMSSFVSTGSMIAKTLLTLIKFVKEHHTLVISATAAIVAYTVTIKAHTIAVAATTVASTAWNLVTKAGVALQGAYKIVALGCVSVMSRLTGNLRRATVAQRALNLAIKSNPMGLLIGLAASAIAAVVSYTDKTKEAAKREKELAEEKKRIAEEERKRVADMSDIAAMSAENAKKELSELERLYNATQDETRAKEERLSAANELIRKYPEYFSQLNAEKILVGEAKSMYDNLTQSILMTAKARAAQAKMEENYGSIIELELQKEERRKELQEKHQREYLDYVKPGEKVPENFAGGSRSTANHMEYRSSGIGGTGGGWYWTEDALEYHTQRINKSIENTLESEFKAIGELNQANEKLDSIIRSTNINAGGGSGGETPEDPKDWREKQNAINRTSYATGQVDYEQFLQKKHDILIEYYNRMLQKTDLSENERLSLLAEKAEEEQSWNKKQNDDKEKMFAEDLKGKLDNIDKQYEETRTRETAWCYNLANENYGNEKILHEKLFQANIEYLKRKEQLYREEGKNDEADKIQLERETLVENEKIRKHKEYLSLYRKLQNDYLNITNKEKKQAELETLDALHAEGIVKEIEYQELKRKIEERYSSSKDAENFKRRYLDTEDKLKEELDLLERFYTEGSIKEEEYQQLKLKIKEKYSKEEEKHRFSDNGYGDMLANMYSAWDGLINGTTDKTISSMEKIATVAQSTWAIAGAALEQYSAYAQACCDVEVAEIEAKYDKEIAAAGKNQKRVAQLEELKEKDIAKIKSKYNKQAMTIEMAQAVAQTAMAAINAYASAAAVPVVGYILAPIAAAMAVAAGALQIATIKKQHQAQSSGYYRGGFTRRSLNDREEVGVVHANEFVANAEAVRNPNVSPVLSLIDYAQRNNTIGSLTTDDVIGAMGSGAVAKATATSAGEAQRNSAELLNVAVSVGQTGDTLKKLNERLEKGIEAFMVMDGERGFDSAYTEYNKLKSRTKR